MSPEKRLGAAVAFTVLGGLAAIVVTPWVRAEEPRLDLHRHVLVPRVDLHGVAQESADASVYIVGDRGTILHGDPASNTWTTEATPTKADLRSVAVDSRYKVAFAVGDGGVILRRSAEGVWDAEASPTTKNLEGVTAIGRDIYAIGAGGVILRRSDAVRGWVEMTSPTRVDLHAVVSTSQVPTHRPTYTLHTQALAVGDDGTILVLTDREHWTAARSSTHANLRAVTSAGPLAVAVGDGGVIVSSQASNEHDPGHAEWRVEPSSTTADLASITIGSIPWARTHGSEISSSRPARFAIGRKGVLVAHDNDSAELTWTAAEARIEGDRWVGSGPIYVGASGAVLVPTRAPPRMEAAYTPPPPVHPWDEGDP